MNFQTYPWTKEIQLDMEAEAYGFCFLFPLSSSLSSLTFLGKGMLYYRRENDEKDEMKIPKSSFLLA